MKCRADVLPDVRHRRSAHGPTKTIQTVQAVCVYVDESLPIIPGLVAASGTEQLFVRSLSSITAPRSQIISRTQAKTTARGWAIDLEVFLSVDPSSSTDAQH